MNIVIISPTSVPLNQKILGGADSQLLKFYKFLKKEHQVKLYAGKQINKLGIYNFLEIYKKKLKCDLLIVYRKALVLPELEAKYKVFYSQDTIDTPCFNHFREKPNYLNGFDEIICLSQFHADHIRKETMYGGKIRVIGNSTSVTPTRELKKETNDFIYASAPHKGLLQLAMFWKKHGAKYPDTKLHIYSSFELYGAKDMDKQYNDWERIKKINNVVFHGIIDNKALLKEIKKAKLMIYPCNYAETYGNIINEAKAMKTPIITTPIGSIPELILEKEVLVKGKPYTDQFFNDFSETITKILEHPQKYEEIQRNMKARTDQEYYHDLKKFLGEVKQNV